MIAAMLLWLLLAIVASATGQVAAVPAPFPQLMLVALTLLLIVLEGRNRKLRALVARIPVRGLVALHITRFVGIPLLLAGSRGILPARFAQPAGWGDVAVAVLATMLLLSGAPTSPGRRALYRAWNALGLLDLLLVVGNAARLTMTDRASMAALLHLPFSLLPLWLVPILLATHVWLFRRLAGDRVEVS